MGPTARKFVHPLVASYLRVLQRQKVASMNEQTVPVSPVAEFDPKIAWEALTGQACETFRRLLDHPDPEIRLKTARTIMELKFDLWKG